MARSTDFPEKFVTGVILAALLHSAAANPGSESYFETMPRETCAYKIIAIITVNNT
jgi:hypothetical protein